MSWYFTSSNNNENFISTVTTATPWYIKMKISQTYRENLDNIVGDCPDGIDIPLWQDTHQAGTVSLKDPVCNVLILTILCKDCALLVISGRQMHVNLGTRKRVITQQQATVWSQYGHWCSKYCFWQSWKIIEKNFRLSTPCLPGNLKKTHSWVILAPSAHI